jgi:hypothetical protein
MLCSLSVLCVVSTGTCGSGSKMHMRDVVHAPPLAGSSCWYSRSPCNSLLDPSCNSKPLHRDLPSIQNRGHPSAGVMRTSVPALHCLPMDTQSSAGGGRLCACLCCGEKPCECTVEQHKTTDSSTGRCAGTQWTIINCLQPCSQQQSTSNAKLLEVFSTICTSSIAG